MPDDLRLAVAALRIARDVWPALVAVVLVAVLADLMTHGWAWTGRRGRS